ncbi:MAG TPA: heavy metal sensor histidine kinase [Clostridia bacterium]|uniref:sensor histidine kinase n=1 Tax=Thermoanaerobacter indiensis TaxID=1125974 RepID=UPI0003775CF6|nr:heavy metal sensor histidine kinase [Thermoanaerobacter indiensis]HHW57918.1 heavy metal sensor histidine kinase [Clostridia bacterium]
MKKNYFPLKLKLTLWYVLLLTIVITIFSVVTYLSLEKMIIVNEDTILKTQVQQISSVLDIENGKIKSGDEPFYANTDFYGALYSYPDLKLIESNIPSKILSQYATNTDFIGKFQTVTSPEGKLRMYSAPVYYDSKIIGIIVIAQSLNLMDIAMKNLFGIFTIIIPILIGIAILGGIIISNKALKPISHMTKVAREISVGDLSKRLNLPYTNDEVGNLAQTFDMMIEKLENSFKRQKQFTHDASHELRTPIAVIQTQAESALNSTGTKEEYKKALQVILEEAKHMSKLVHDLLFLARSDSNTEKLTIENLNFSELIEGIVNELAPLAENNGLTLKIIKNDSSYIRGDQTRIIQLFYNLIDNAIKYTPAGGKVEISVENAGKFIKTSIKDTGIGIPEEHLPHIFERFYRVDKARTRKSGGSGLGLSICQWIINAHGGKIQVESCEGKGTTFVVWLPTLKK